MQLSEELQMTCRIAEEAGTVAERFFRSEDIGTRSKGWRDVVTAGDTAGESLIRERLTEAFPDDAIVGEEGTEVSGTSGRRWYLDPIDGTLNYSRGLPIWCVSMALFDEDGPLLGVIRNPLRGDTFSAGRGLGAYLNGRRLTTSQRQDPSEALVHVTIDFHEGSMAAGLADIQVVAPHVLRTRNIGSAALALAYVAAGHFDAMLHRHAHTWDYGAGVLLIQESGGIVIDMQGQPYREGTKSVIAGASEALTRSLFQVMTG